MVHILLSDAADRILMVSGFDGGGFGDYGGDFGGGFD